MNKGSHQYAQSNEPSHSTIAQHSRERTERESSREGDERNGEDEERSIARMMIKGERWVITAAMK